MKLGQIVYDADIPVRTGELTLIGSKLARVTAPGGGFWLVPLARLRQGNGRGLAKRRTVKKKQAEARKYQPMSERSRRELRALVTKESCDKFPANWLRDRVLRLLDDLDELHRQAKGKQ